MAKTNITAYDMQELFKSLYYDFDYDVIIDDGVEHKQILIGEYLRTEFYTYTKDTRDNNQYYDGNGNGFNFANFDQWLKSFGAVSTSYAQVELSGLEVVSSEDIDMGSATATITFVMQIDKADIFEKYISKLRLVVAGKRHSFLNSDGEEIAFYATIGELNYDESPIDTPLGKCVVVSLTFGISFMQDTATSNQANIEISLNGSDYEHLYYNEMTNDIMFTGKPNIKQGKPFASGMVNSSVSYATTITYWIFIKDNLQLKINQKLKELVDDNTTFTEIDTINIPVWIKEYIPIYDDDGLLSTKTITTKMTIVDYKTNYKNSDFINVSLSLNRYGK